jgi:tetratricopeptide (TPR) repeat protein
MKSNMHKINRIGIWLILILISLFQLQTQAQSKKYFVINGKIVPEISDAGTGQIEIKKNNNDITTIDIPKNGRFRLELEFFNEYYLTFKYPKHFNKIILVSTEIPKEVWERDNDFPPLPIIVQMQQEFEGIDKSFTLKPQGRIFYAKEIDNFEKEVYISDIQFKEQLETAKVQANKVQKEAQSISKENAQDLAEKQKNFDLLIKEADAQYQRGEYQQALMKYLEARKLFPEKAYPNDRVSELQDLVKALEITAKQKADLEQKYQAAISKANGFFDQKTYTSARPLYEEALQYKPGDVFANGRIKEIDQLLALQEKQKKYNDLIAQADNNYKSKKLDQALAMYNQALLVVPDDSYSKNQISLINSAQEELARTEQTEKDYNAAIQIATVQTEKKDYLQALNSYKKALELKPDSKLAKDKIGETEQAIALAEMDKKYQQAIQLADQAMAANDLQNAKLQYIEAQKIKSAEVYPKTKLDEIARAEAKETQFNELINNAEKEFTANNYSESLKLFSQALELKPKNPDALKRVEEIQNIQKIQTVNKEYADLIALGDQSFQNNQMDGSLQAYNRAIQIKKSESYPKDQIRKIELYQSLIKKSDQQTDAKDYTAALKTLNDVLNIKPEDRFIKDKIASVEKLIADKKRLEDQILAEQKAYDEAIKNADQFFAGQQYNESLTKYKEANSIKASESYPAKRIKEIEDILKQLAKDQAQKDKDYQLAISQADKLLDKKDYAGAQTEYRKAVEIKSEEIYPHDQLKKIDEALVQIKIQEEEKMKLQREKTEQEFNLAMSNANLAFASNDYNQAKTGYQTALRIKPNDATAKEKLGQTEAKLGQIAKMTQAYNTAITEANRQLTAKLYQEAREKYQEALQYLPDSEYPKNQVAKIDEILARQLAETKLKQDFNQAVNEAESLFKSKEFAKAKDAYTKAYNLIPSEPVPPKRINEINDLLAEQLKKDAALKATMDAYQNAIQRADKHFGNKEYSSARLVYNEALMIKSDEKYPADQLALIEKLLTEQNDQQYKSAIATGDNSFNSNNFDSAITAYQEALKLKKGDQYASRKLKDIEVKKAALTAENNRLKKLQIDYEALIADAAIDFRNKDYMKSIGKYNQALVLKPDETFPKERIASINKILEELKIEEDLNKQYIQHITLAQKAFASNKLKDARDEYQKANEIKPSEPIPPARITEIDRLIAQQEEIAKLAAMEEAQRLAKEKADKDTYDKAIAAADKAFAEKQYTIARTHYFTAQIAQLNQKYPKDQIEKIDEILRQQQLDLQVAAQKAKQDSILKERDRLFELAMSAAKDLEQKNQFGQAILKYGEAVQINPAQKSMVQKLIDNADEKLKLLVRQDEEYKRRLKLADDSFTAEKLENALTQYQNALKIKPNEDYPKGRITEIQNILASKEQNYISSIQKADQAFDISDWQTAKTSYIEALAFKPNEVYPANRLKEVNKKIAEANQLQLSNASEEKAYREALDKAENTFKAGQLNNAKMQFEVARTLRPNEQIPVDRIREINALIDQRNKDQLEAAQRALDEKYRLALSVADNSFKDKSYAIAKLQYKQALLIKPDETYPKDQMALCDKRLSETQPAETYTSNLPSVETAKQVSKTVYNPAETAQATEARANSYQLVATYDDAVKRADDAFGIKDYSVARFFYLKAGDIKPNEEYPKNQVELIRKLIDSQLSANDVSGYDLSISKADDAFAKRNYSIAKFFYNKAIEIKSWEKYPKDRINEILLLTNSMFSEKEEKDYRDFLAKADDAFFRKDLSIARFYYNKAITIKKDESYPLVKLKDIQTLIEQDRLEQENQEYQKIIDLADQALQSKNYSIARFNYNKALTIRPDEKYPKDQLKSIKEAVEKQEK